MDEQIEAKVAATLAQTPYAFTSLVKLGGGTANFIYHAVLSQALQDNTKDVIVKQGEAYVATRPSFPIPLSRCVGPSSTLLKTQENYLLINSIS